MIKITLPHGPSSNHYMGRCGNRSYLKKGAIEYHKKVAYEIARQRLNRACSGPVHVVYEVWHPDHRRRDLGNLDKVMSDSLTRCGFWGDDVDIYHLELIRKGVDKANPRVEVTVTAYKE